jgi:ribosome biogenesis protein ERB1
MMEQCMCSTQRCTSTLIHALHACAKLWPHSDLTRNPLIVPLKILKGHGVRGGVGVLCMAFHTRQPWLFSGGADGIVNLYQDI